MTDAEPEANSHGYIGTHLALGGGMCEHRWANRLTRTVRCDHALIVEARAAALAAVRDALTDDVMHGVLIVLPPPEGFVQYRDAVRDRLRAILDDLFGGPA